MTVLDVPITTSGVSALARPSRRGFLVAAGLAASLSTATCATSAIHLPEDLHPWTVAGMVSTVGSFIESTPITPGDAVRRLHERTGLSWEQLSRLFGVSRRSLHNWASGGAINADNAERLAQLTAEVASLGDTPEQVRAALLTPDDTGMTYYQRLIQTRAAGRTERREPLQTALRDGEVTILGEFAEVGPSIDLEQGWPRRQT